MGSNSNNLRSYRIEPGDIKAAVAALLLREDLGGAAWESMGMSWRAADHWSRKEEEGGGRGERE